MNAYKVTLVVFCAGAGAVGLLASRSSQSESKVHSAAAPETADPVVEPPYRRRAFASSGAATAAAPSLPLPDTPAVPSAVDPGEPPSSPPPPPEPALPPPRNDTLEKILAGGTQNAAWESEVTAQFAAKYGSASDVHISALRCSDAFCRIELTLPPSGEAQSAAIGELRQMFEVDGPLMLDVNQTSEPPVGLLYVSKKGTRVPFPPPRHAMGT